MWRRQSTAGLEACQEAERTAAQLELHLQAGGALVPIPVTGLLLDGGETAFADVTCSVARYYGTEILYPPGGAGYFEDHPTFGRQWVPNRRLDERRRREAEADAQERWRDHTSARVVLTSAGLRISPDEGTWLPFDHVLLTDVTTHTDQPTVTLSYSVCAPVLLSGSAAPWLGVAIRHLCQQQS